MFRRVLSDRAKRIEAYPISPYAETFFVETKYLSASEPNEKHLILLRPISTNQFIQFRDDDDFFLSST